MHLLLILSACATMRRSWEFTPAEIAASGGVELVVVRARVSQEDLSLSVRLQNPGPEPLVLTLAGIRVLDHPLRPALGAGRVDWLLQSPRALYVGTLAPGAAQALELRAHVPARDLRRLERLELEGELLLGEQAQPLTLTLVAPPGAPLGEQR